MSNLIGKGPNGEPVPVAVTLDGEVKVSGGTSGGGDASSANQGIQSGKLDTLHADLGKLDTLHADLGTLTTLHADLGTLTTLHADLGTLTSRIPAVGSTTMANSLPVTLAYDGPMVTATGAKEDVAATDSNSSWSIVALLKGVLSALLGTIKIVAAPPRTVATATIANGASVSGTIDLSMTVLLAFIAPAAWTTAALNFEVSADGVTWVTAGMYDSTGSAVGSWASLTASASYNTDPAIMLPWKYLRLRSGTAGTPVVQGADRVITLVSRPIA